MLDYIDCLEDDTKSQDRALYNDLFQNVGRNIYIGSLIYLNQATISKELMEMYLDYLFILGRFRYFSVDQQPLI